MKLSTCSCSIIGTVWTQYWADWMRKHLLKVRSWQLIHQCRFLLVCVSPPVQSRSLRSVVEVLRLQPVSSMYRHMETTTNIISKIHIRPEYADMDHLHDNRSYGDQRHHHGDPITGHMAIVDWHKVWYQKERKWCHINWMDWMNLFALVWQLVSTKMCLRVFIKEKIWVLVFAEPDWFRQEWHHAHLHRFTNALIGLLSLLHWHMTLTRKMKLTVASTNQVQILLSVWFGQL